MDRFALDQLPNKAITRPPTRTTPGDAYLKFRLTDQLSAALAMRSVQEAIVLPTRRLTPMPTVPAALMGLMNRRSRVVWVVDLAQLLGFAMLDSNAQQHSLILVQVGTVPLGLAVQQVEGMIRLLADQIHPAVGQISASLVPYLRGCALPPEPEQEQEMLLILDAEAIVQAPVLRHHT